jgi:hypothetical protein
MLELVAKENVGFLRVLFSIYLYLSKIQLRSDKKIDKSHKMPPIEETTMTRITQKQQNLVFL